MDHGERSENASKKPTQPYSVMINLLSRLGTMPELNSLNQILSLIIKGLTL